MLASFDSVHDFGVQIWKFFDTSTLVYVMKGLACSLMLITWWNSYQKGLREGKPRFDYWTLIYGVLYISLVVNCDTIIRVLDSAMVDIGNMFVGNFPMPDNDFDMFQDTVFGGSDTSNLPAEKGTMVKLKEAIVYIASFDWIYDGMARGFLMFTVITDYSYFLFREFMLIGAKLLMPIVLALAVIPGMKDKVMKWITIYIGIYLTGYLFILSIGVANAAFAYFISPAADIIDTGPHVGGNAALLLPKLLLFAACVKAKVQMFNGSIELTKRVFA